MNQIWLNTPKSQITDSVVRITSSGRRNGQRHVAEGLPRPGAVDAGRLEHLARDLGDPGVQRDRQQRDGAPDDHQR